MGPWVSLHATWYMYSKFDKRYLSVKIGIPEEPITISWSFGHLFRPSFVGSQAASRIRTQDGSWSKQRMRLAQIVRSQTFETIMGVVIVLTLVLLGCWQKLSMMALWLVNQPPPNVRSEKKGLIRCYYGKRIQALDKALFLRGVGCGGRGVGWPGHDMMVERKKNSRLGWSQLIKKLSWWKGKTQVHFRLK